MHDLELIDVDLQITHGGSMRYTIAHKGFKKVSQNVVKLINNERRIGFDKKETYFDFTNSVIFNILSMTKKN